MTETPESSENHPHDEDKDAVPTPTSTAPDEGRPQRQPAEDSGVEDASRPGPDEGSTMTTIQTTGDLARPVVVDDDASGVTGELELASADDVTFPSAWKDGERLYDVEIWHDGELIATVPPQSEDVDASFAEHERRRRT